MPCLCITLQGGGSAATFRYCTAAGRVRYGALGREKYFISKHLIISPGESCDCARCSFGHELLLNLVHAHRTSSRSPPFSPRTASISTLTPLLFPLSLLSSLHARAVPTPDSSLLSLLFTSTRNPFVSACASASTRMIVEFQLNRYPFHRVSLLSSRPIPLVLGPVSCFIPRIEARLAFVTPLCKLLT